MARGPNSAALESLCLTLLRESLSFGNLRGSHAASYIISKVRCILLRVTFRVGCCVVEPHIGSHIIQRDVTPLGIQPPESDLRIREALGSGCSHH